MSMIIFNALITDESGEIAVLLDAEEICFLVVALAEDLVGGLGGAFYHGVCENSIIFYG